jgi:alkanesulfonate monooxygenase SsuD/methylene tetrahydromethanopterin reductase-like flavin-dependent oxidoreductase (luciferase family)
MGGMILHMKTDLLLIPMDARWTDMRAAAVAADEAGFDGLWTWDHLRDNDGGGAPPEAWTVLTALAEATERVMLGPLVLNVANRHPGVLASMAATLQTVSGGRLLLGLGAGGSRRTPYAIEQAAIGQKVDGDAARAQKVVDAIALIRKLWAARPASCGPTRRRRSSWEASARAWRASRGATATASTRRPCTRSSPTSPSARATSTRRADAIPGVSS